MITVSLAFIASKEKEKNIRRDREENLERKRGRRNKKISSVQH